MQPPFTIATVKLRIDGGYHTLKNNELADTSFEILVGWGT